MKIDWKYWLFLACFVASQLIICLAMQRGAERLSIQLWEAQQQISNQIAGE